MHLISYNYLNFIWKRVFDLISSDDFSYLRIYLCSHRPRAEMCMQVVTVPVTTNVGCSNIWFSLCATAVWHNKETQKYFMICTDVRTIFISWMDFNGFGRKVLLLYLLCTKKNSECWMLPDWDRNPSKCLMRMCYWQFRKKKKKAKEAKEATQEYFTTFLHSAQYFNLQENLLFKLS